MTSLIDQLYDIAHNAEFSEDQRKNLMQIALDEAGETNRLFPLIKVSHDEWFPALFFNAETAEVFPCRTMVEIKKPLKAIITPDPVSRDLDPIPLVEGDKVVGEMVRQPDGSFMTRYVTNA